MELSTLWIKTRPGDDFPELGVAWTYQALERNQMGFFQECRNKLDAYGDFLQEWRRIELIVDDDVVERAFGASEDIFEMKVEPPKGEVRILTTWMRTPQDERGKKLLVAMDEYLYEYSAELFEEKTEELLSATDRDAVEIRHVVLAVPSTDIEKAFTANRVFAHGLAA